MTLPLRRVAVLGAGNMGCRIAAHFANAGIPSLLLDLPNSQEGPRNLLAQRGVQNALQQKPPGFFVESAASLIETGNFEDDLPRIRDCGWVIEAVTESLEIKRALWQIVDVHRSPDAILSTNTSGIPLARIAVGFSPEFRRQFLGTHFFNPPRYMHLLELIPTPDTAPEIVRFVSDFADKRLGKGVVSCKDTPNFIANRLGSFFGATVAKLTVEGNYSVEEVDTLTGPLIGLPKSASFRLLDVVGLDVWAFVARNLYELLPDDNWRERFVPPPFLDQMISRGWLGEKSGQGFYRRVGKGEDRLIEALDWRTLEYHPAAKASFPSVELARNIEALPDRLRHLLSTNDRASDFLWPLFRDYCLYAAERIPEISDRIVEVDRAMRWGYGHTYGPFELWDVLGFQETAARIEQDGFELPPLARQMLSANVSSFYRAADENGRPVTEYFDLGRSGYLAIEERPGILVLSDLKRARGEVARNAGASLVDLGDGVLCLEFHSKMNALGEDPIRMIHAGIEETEKNFQALVIGNQAPDFSVGANLMLILMAAQEGEWEELSEGVRRFQEANMAIKCAPIPVVAAPFGRTLGGGAEIAMHAARIQASAELYMGLVETGVGLIPAGGGCKELLLRSGDPKLAFETIGYAKVSGSAAEAARMKMLDPRDRVSINPERLLADAKDLALQLVPNYSPHTPRHDIPVGGEPAYALLRLGAWLARQGEFISDHDLLIADKLAHVLSGGRLSGPAQVSEQYLLDLEREAFLSLCGHPRTQQRMAHMLNTGKPLRN